ncbi:hypothetical protein, no similarity [Maudiozyma barnettii]|uniref:Uncharacterized protein n=1 Tax=Maudiozyma barnettii TaxID=61262 RepID=A0A8H2VHY6_9SACH|nr:hypothetical protein, no similarity [Kazachstania barnettii]CAB4255569.1 hypothetical protein, no similarity [Kazachstania barnettii]CAD1784067.1 hypothetical protein, no similarity [Kazachstania barnettii]
MIDKTKRGCGAVRAVRSSAVVEESLIRAQQSVLGARGVVAGCTPKVTISIARAGYPQHGKTVWQSRQSRQRQCSGSGNGRTPTAAAPVGVASEPRCLLPFTTCHAMPRHATPHHVTWRLVGRLVGHLDPQLAVETLPEQSPERRAFVLRRGRWRRSIRDHFTLVLDQLLQRTLVQVKNTSLLGSFSNVVLIQYLNNWGHCALVWLVCAVVICFMYKYASVYICLVSFFAFLKHFEDVAYFFYHPLSINFMKLLKFYTHTYN